MATTHLVCGQCHSKITCLPGKKFFSVLLLTNDGVRILRPLCHHCVMFIPQGKKRAAFHLKENPLVNFCLVRNLIIRQKNGEVILRTKGKVLFALDKKDMQECLPNLAKKFWPLA